MFNLGPTEALVILGVAVLFFGPSKLPELGSSIGRALRGFKEGVKEVEEKATTEAPVEKQPSERQS